jgi:UDP:flavonoid glycosyltransferase YjiC (YdhE family)
MKIGMQTWGSHGDVRPFLALAEGLQSAGHQVTLVITCVDSDAFNGLQSALGVDIRVVASPVVSGAQATALIHSAYEGNDPMKQLAKLLRLGFDPAEEAMFEAARRLCAECDLLIGHYFLHPLQVAAAHAGKPYVSVMLSHGGVPSAYDHPLSVAALGKPGNRLLWWLTKSVLQRALGHYPNRLRARLGMAPVANFVEEVWLSQALTLVAVSPQLCRRMPDWPQAVQVCGFLDMPNIAAEGEVPAALEAFLAAGEAPVYMTFGSWTPPDLATQSATLKLFGEAARLAGCRAIIQARSWRACGVEPSERIFHVDAAPHHAVFPRCAAVVHHGGAGTTQSATLAGVPSIVVPHISEQEFWARELRRVGVAGRAIKRRKLDAATLAERIGEVLGRPSMRAAANAIAQPMKRENGVAAAVALIEQRFAGVPAQRAQNAPAAA